MAKSKHVKTSTTKTELRQAVADLKAARKVLRAERDAALAEVARLEAATAKTRKAARGAHLVYRELYEINLDAWGEVPYTDEEMSEIGFRLDRAVARLVRERDEARQAAGTTEDSPSGLLSKVSEVFSGGPRPMRHVDELIASDEQIAARRDLGGFQ